jgi:hypothetical protein
VNIAANEAINICAAFMTPLRRKALTVGRGIAKSAFQVCRIYRLRAASDKIRPLQLNETVLVVPRIGVGPMSKYTTSAIISAAVSVSTFATAHAQQTAVTIPDNDSVYIDAKSFQVVPGKGKGDAGAQIKDLGARELGPGAIIIRSGNKLYIAEGQTLRGVVTAYAYDPRQYNPALTGGGSVGYNQQFAYDPRQYNPALTGGGSVGYNQQFAYDPRQYNPALTGGGSIGYNQQFINDPRQPQYDPRLTGGGSAGYNAMLMQFLNDPRQPQYDPRLTGGGSAGYNATLMQFAYDPDYVQYKLKKAFEDNWISASTK